MLPPWAHLPHWRSKSLAGLQNNIPWGKFFELDSMKTYIPVMELKDLIKGENISTITSTLRNLSLCLRKKPSHRPCSLLATL